LYRFNETGEILTRLILAYLVGPNYRSAPNWPRPKLAFGQLGPKLGQDSPKTKIKDKKV